MLAEDMQVSLKRLALAILGLAALSVLAEGLIRLEMPLRQPGHLFAQLFSLALGQARRAARKDGRVGAGASRGESSPRPKRREQLIPEWPARVFSAKLACPLQA